MGGVRLGDYVRRQARGGIIVDPTLRQNVGAIALLDERRILLTPSTAASSTALLAGAILHEARHLEMQRWHSCGKFDGAGDRTMEEGGAYAVHILYLEHVGEMGAANAFREFIGC